MPCTPKLLVLIREFEVVLVLQDQRTILLTPVEAEEVAAQITAAVRTILVPNGDLSVH